MEDESCLLVNIVLNEVHEKIRYTRLSGNHQALHGVLSRRQQQYKRVQALPIAHEFAPCKNVYTKVVWKSFIASERRIMP